MIWTIIFLISLAQGIFLITLIAFKKSQNLTASRLVTVMIVLMVIINLDFLMLSSGLSTHAPYLFGISFGSMFLFGPLFYFYTRSITEISFKWRAEYYFHFTPYLLRLFLYLPFYLVPLAVKREFIAAYLNEDIPLRNVEAVVFSVQTLHLFIYLAFALKKIKSLKSQLENSPYLISFFDRIRWLNILFYSLMFFCFTVMGILIYITVNRAYIPLANYLYTLVAAITLYMISYNFFFSPHLISPGFLEKYQYSKKLSSDEKILILQKLKDLLEVQKYFTHHELKLSEVAEKIGVPSHRLSKLLNEQYKKTFTELINELRVKEFIERMNREDYTTLSLVGIALDSGFSSKSSFNSIFKKVTGKTPSEFKMGGSKKEKGV
jgi:AraC-like DNA-binding protein